MISDRRRTRLRRVAGVAMLAPALAMTEGFAQTARELKCTGNADIAWEQQLIGCTNAIQSGKFFGKNLSILLSNRGNAYYYGKEQYDRAIADYNEAIRLTPSFGRAYYNRGDAYFAKGEYDRAIADYNVTIRLDPTDADAFYMRGLTKRKKGDNAGADADIAAAKKINPNVGN
jgi:tetratricopeptide (TPR) repeat protein